jgi:hypothetical protein
MSSEKATKQLSDRAVRVMGRLSEGKRAEHDRAIAQVEEELRDRIKRASPSRVALMKLKLARLREGLSLGEIAEKAGIAESVEDVEPPDLLLKPEQIIVLSNKSFEGLEIGLGHMSKRV